MIRHDYPVYPLCPAAGINLCRHISGVLIRGIIPLLLVTGSFGQQFDCNASNANRLICAVDNPPLVLDSQNKTYADCSVSPVELSVRQRLVAGGVVVNKCPCPADMTAERMRSSSCTNVSRFTDAVIDGLINLKQTFQGDIVITGGSEPGHSDDGHPFGQKADLRINGSPYDGSDALSRFIIWEPNSPTFPDGHFAYAGARSNGDPIYGRALGPYFALEYGVSGNTSPHWDTYFPPNWSAQLTVGKSGTGNGTVNADPRLMPSLSCGTNCTQLIAGIRVNLTAQADSQSIFNSWSGLDDFTDTVNEAAATVIANGLRTITATFDPVDGGGGGDPGGPPPPPQCSSGPCSGHWVWDPTLNGGMGGWVWVGDRPLLPCGGTPPASGCWHCDETVGSGAWIHDACLPCRQFGLSACPPGGGINVGIVTSGDPNEKAGPHGAGAGHYLSGLQPLNYSVYFDNQPTATAPAQTITITDTLNSTFLDLSTLVLGPLTFVDKVVTPPSIPLSLLGSYSANVDLRPGKSLIIAITATLNTSTGVLIWSFTSMDPATGLLTTDPLAGLLPPGAEGSVSFNVVPRNASTGTQFTNKATIVFDVNPPMDTAVWLNTVDNTKPASHVNSLAAVQTVTNFPVSWAGSDIGSGVQDYTVYSSDNGGPFTAWQTNTAATSATFTGVIGDTYRFYSIARDLVGNVETSKSMAEATTTISSTLPPTIQCTGCYFLINGVRATLAFNASVVGTSSTFTYNYRTASQTVQFASTTTDQIAVNGNIATISGQGKVNGVTGYNFSVTAKDGGAVGSNLDTVSILITGPNNYSYAANGTIAGGDIVVKQ